MVIIFALTSLLYAQEKDPGKVLNTLADSLNAGGVIIKLSTQTKNKGGDKKWLSI